MLRYKEYNNSLWDANMKRIALIFLVGFILMPSTATAIFEGDDDGFHTNFTHSQPDGACTVDILGQFEDANITGDNTDIGSFDDPDDIGTGRTPIQIRTNLTLSLGCLGGSNEARIRIYETEACSGGTIVDHILTNPAVGNTQEQEFNQTSGWDGFLGEHCVRVDLTADDGVTGTTNSNIHGVIGTAPLLDSITVNEYLNMFYEQTLTHNLEASESGDITNFVYRLINTSNGAVLGFGGTNSRTDSTPSTGDTQQMINFVTNPTFINGNASVSMEYFTWEDNGNTYSRFSTNSTGSNSLGNDPSIDFTLTNTIQCSGYNSDDGISYYNRGEVANSSGTILNATGQAFTITTGVAFDLDYENETDVSQFSDDGWDIDGSGGWDRDNTITSTATAQTTLSPTDAEDYDQLFDVNGDVDSTESSTCQYEDVFEVSDQKVAHSSSTLPSGNPNNADNSYNVNLSSKIYNRGESVSYNYYLFGARGQRFNNTLFNSLTITSEVTASDNSIEDSQTDAGADHFVEEIYGIVSTDLSTFNTLGSPKRVNSSDNLGNREIQLEIGHNVSSLLKMKVDLQVDGVFTNRNSELYNLGEIVTFHTNLTYADNRIFNPATGITAYVYNDNTILESTITGRSTTATGLMNATYTIASTHKNTTIARSQATSSFPRGSPKRLRATQQGNWISIDSGTTNGSKLDIWNVTKTLFCDTHTQSSATLTKDTLSLADPLIEDSKETLDFIIGDDVVYTWSHCKNANGENLTSGTVEFRAFDSDGNPSNPSPTSRTMTTDGWTTNNVQKSAQSPKGTWKFRSFHTDAFGNFGDDNESVSFISPFTGNLFITSSFQAINGSNKKHDFEFNDTVRFTAHVGRIQPNGVKDLQDTDDNELFFTIEDGATGDILSCFNGLQMTRIIEGVYQSNFSLNQSCGFEDNKDYQVVINGKFDGATVVRDNWFMVRKDPSEDDIIMFLFNTEGKKRPLIIGENITIQGRFTRDGVGEFTDTPMQYRIAFVNSSNGQEVLFFNDTTQSLESLPTNEQETWFNMTNATTVNPASDIYLWTKSIDSSNLEAGIYSFRVRATHDGSRTYSSESFLLVPFDPTEIYMVGGVHRQNNEQKLPIVGENLTIGVRTYIDTVPRDVDNITARIARFDSVTGSLLILNITDNTFVNANNVLDDQFLSFDLTKLSTINPALDNFTWIRNIETSGWESDNYFAEFRAETEEIGIFHTTQFIILENDRQEVDPKDSQCTQTAEVGDIIGCIIELSYLNATPLTGQSPTINITAPDDTSTVTTMAELFNFGIYEHEFVATQSGRYLVTMNNTLENINYASAQFVNVKSSFFNDTNIINTIEDHNNTMTSEHENLNTTVINQGGTITTQDIEDIRDAVISRLCGVARPLCQEVFRKHYDNPIARIFK